MRFRPLPGLTVATLAALAVLISLGRWQLERAEQKRELIAERERIQSARVFEDLSGPLCTIRASASGQVVESPDELTGAEIRFYGARADGAPGWRLLRLTPAPDCDADADGGYFVVEAGFETLDGERAGAPDRLEISAWPRPNAFTSQNDPALGDYYRFDADELADAFGVPPGAIDEQWWLPAHVEGLPPALADMPPSRHLGYAATWFGIAIVLVGVYLAYHVRAGRFGR